MKNKLTAVAFILSTALLATGCDSSNVTLKKDGDGKSIIYSLTVDGKAENFTADDLLEKLQDSSTAKSTLYSEISKQVFTAYADANLSASVLKTIKTDAAEKIEEFKANAKSDAKSSGTDYDVYIKNALSNNGVKSLEELEDRYVFEGKKEKILEDFIEDNYEYFLNKYLETYTPYQVKHVLVAANTADSLPVTGTMTADNARKLIRVLNGFISGEDFASVSDLTDDTSSKNNGGVMPFNEGQNYVNEFRFAPYVLDVFDNNDSLEDRYNKAIKLHLISSDMTKEEFEDSDLYKAYAEGIDTLDSSALLEFLNQDVQSKFKGGYNYWNDDERKDGVKVPTVAEQPYEMNVRKYKDDGEINEDYYYEEYELARNYAFNKYLNVHKVRYIEVDESCTSSIEWNGKNILVDSASGKPIYVVLASTGIHFMCNVWDAPTKSSEDNAKYFSLFDNSTDVTNYKDTYENTYIGQNQAYYYRSSLESNSKKLLNAISSYAGSAEYYLFNCLVYGDTELNADDSGKATVTFYDDDLNDLVKEYVENKLATPDSFAETVVNAAKQYASKLARESEARKSLNAWYSDYVK